MPKAVKGGGGLENAEGSGHVAKNKHFPCYMGNASGGLASHDHNRLLPTLVSYAVSVDGLVPTMRISAGAVSIRNCGTPSTANLLWE